MKELQSSWITPFKSIVTRQNNQILFNYSESRVAAALFLCPEGGEAVVSGERGFPAGGAGEHTEMLLIEELCAGWSVHDSRYELERL